MAGASIAVGAFLTKFKQLAQRLDAGASLADQLSTVEQWLAEVIDAVRAAHAVVFPITLGAATSGGGADGLTPVPPFALPHLPEQWRDADTSYLPVVAADMGHIGGLVLRGDPQRLGAVRDQLDLVVDKLRDLMKLEILSGDKQTAELVRLNQELKQSLDTQEFLNDRLFENARVLQRTQRASIKALARLAEYRDFETGDHLQRICEFTYILARSVADEKVFPSYPIDEDYLQDIYLSAMLHDIGKVAIPDNILLKPGSLEPDEWEVMKQHTTWGWEIMTRADEELGEQSFLTLAASIARYHHERFDGSGYPEGLSGEDIPLSSRIVSIADVYDALTSRRPYKEPWEHERTVEEIRAQAERHHDPQLVELFVGVEERFRAVRARLAG